MRVSVSQIKNHMECPQKAHNRYTLLRGSPEISTPLEVGTLLHLALQHILQPRPSPEAIDYIPVIGWEEAVDEAIAAQDILTPEDKNWVKAKKEFAVLRQSIAVWEVPDDWECTFVEREMEVPCGRHTIVGTLDSQVVWNGSTWHGQHKSIAATKPLPVFYETQRTDWHEAVYQRMLELSGVENVAGTMLNIFRKLSQKAIDEKGAASACLWQPLARSVEEVDAAFTDLHQIIELMQDDSVRIIKNRCACGGMFGNKLCEYKPVCDGTADIMDPDKYIQLEKRYAETPNGDD